MGEDDGGLYRRLGYAVVRKLSVENKKAEYIVD
jgi:hypothetical protein